LSRRKAWQNILDAEVRRWSALSCEELVSQLRDVQAYEVELDSQTYQVEVDLLEDTEQYRHVMVAVDDGSLPSSLSPLVQTFLREKRPPTV
jgi:hypothetical protein